jgi:hypothetical protein
VTGTIFPDSERYVSGLAYWSILLVKKKKQ